MKQHPKTYQKPFPACSFHLSDYCAVSRTNPQTAHGVNVDSERSSVNALKRRTCAIFRPLTAWRSLTVEKEAEDFNSHVVNL